MTARAFTLVEVMMAVLLLALLAAGAGMSFSGPLRAARGRDAIERIADTDADARRAAVASGAEVQLEFDLADATIARLERGSSRARLRLPTGFRIDQLRVAGRSASAGLVPIDVAAHGWTRTYAVRVVGPGGFDRWICFAGLTGERSEVADARALPTPPPGHDAD